MLSPLVGASCRSCSLTRLHFQHRLRGRGSPDSDLVPTDGVGLFARRKSGRWRARIAYSSRRSGDRCQRRFADARDGHDRARANRRCTARRGAVANTITGVDRRVRRRRRSACQKPEQPLAISNGL
jgi:hypothetical protein